MRLLRTKVEITTTIVLDDGQRVQVKYKPIVDHSSYLPRIIAETTRILYESSEELKIQDIETTATLNKP